MTVKELREAIEAKGMIIPKTVRTKAELELIWNGLNPGNEVTEPLKGGEVDMTVKHNDEVSTGSTTKENDNNEDNSDQTEEGNTIITDADNFDELLGKIEGASSPEAKAKEEKAIFEKKKRKSKKGESDPNSFRVEGYVLLLVTDTVFPSLLAFVNNMIDKKGKKIKVSDLRLAEQDFNKLEPLADQAADYISIQLNPIAGFFLVASFMYANNLIAIKMNVTNT